MNDFFRAVFIAFINDGKLLVCKSVRSAKLDLYTLIGGAVEKDESLLEAAVREAKEEINSDFDLKQRDLEQIFCITEPASSNPDILVEFNIFISQRKIDVELQTNLEILDHKWYDINNKDNIKVSSTIEKYVLPYMIEKGLLN